MRYKAIHDQFTSQDVKEVRRMLNCSVFEAMDLCEKHAARKIIDKHVKASRLNPELADVLNYLISKVH